MSQEPINHDCRSDLSFFKYFMNRQRLREKEEESEGERERETHIQHV
jgi:hypothetical protein